MREVTQEQFLQLFDERVRSAIFEAAIRNKATHIVRFVNMQMDASDFGSATAVVVGPDCTYKTVDELKGRHLHDLPSQRQYPAEFCEVDLSKEISFPATERVEENGPC